MPDDHAELLAGAKRGDEGAWKAIVSQLGPKLQGYARAKGVSDPEDLMQDVLLAAAERIHGFEGSWDSFRSWLFTIAHRRIADTHRRAGRSPALVPMEATMGAPDETRTPEAHLLADEQLHETLQALETLSPIEREVLLLRIVGELDSEEVGRIVGKRPGTVRVIQSRAVQKIKQTMQEPLTARRRDAEEHVVKTHTSDAHAGQTIFRRNRVTNSSTRRLRG